MRRRARRAGANSGRRRRAPARALARARRRARRRRRARARAGAAHAAVHRQRAGDRDDAAGRRVLRGDGLSALEHRESARRIAVVLELRRQRRDRGDARVALRARRRASDADRPQPGRRHGRARAARARRRRSTTASPCAIRRPARSFRATRSSIRSTAATRPVVGLSVVVRRGDRVRQADARAARPVGHAVAAARDSRTASTTSPAISFPATCSKARTIRSATARSATRTCATSRCRPASATSNAARIEGLARDPAARAWIDAYSPDKPPAPLPDLAHDDAANLVHAADLWYEVKRHWCIEAQALARAQRSAERDDARASERIPADDAALPRAASVQRRACRRHRRAARNGLARRRDRRRARASRRERAHRRRVPAALRVRRRCCARAVACGHRRHERRGDPCRRDRSGAQHTVRRWARVADPLLRDRLWRALQARPRLRSLHRRWRRDRRAARGNRRSLCRRPRRRDAASALSANVPVADRSPSARRIARARVAARARRVVAPRGAAAVSARRRSLQRVRADARSMPIPSPASRPAPKCGMSRATTCCSLR